MFQFVIKIQLLFLQELCLRVTKLDEKSDRSIPCVSTIIENNSTKGHTNYLKNTIGYNISMS